MRRSPGIALRDMVVTIVAMVLVCSTGSVQARSALRQIPSKDGVRIAVECTGHGPTLLFVHGGVGDRTRWLPLFPLFADHFLVCAMDRRGHGDSGDSPDYSLQKEIDDVVAVVDALPAPAFVMGHSYGGVAAIEAAQLAPRISRLVLYEPPLLDRIDESIVNRMEALIQAGQREDALILFQREIVKVSDGEIAAMRFRASWPALVSTVDSQVRQNRELNRYRFDPERMRRVTAPTLLLTGSRSTSPTLNQALRSLMDVLPHRELKVFEGQEHNAMDAVPGEFADVVTAFIARR